jgi:hypothetical protein
MERASAIGRTLAVPSSPSDQRKLPSSGETALLVYSQSAGEDILVTTANGLSLRLAGLGWLGPELKAGDVLPVRILSTQPTLELEFSAPEPNARPANAQAGMTSRDAMNQHTAMRLDQAELRTITWRPPDPAVLGAAWRTLAQERWQQPASPIDRWATPVYAWGGISIALRLVEADEESAVPGTPRRRRGLAVRLDVIHPMLGHLVIQVQGLLSGVRVDVIVEEASSVEEVRMRWPAVRAALAHAGFNLAHVSVTQGDIRQPLAATGAAARQHGGAVGTAKLPAQWFASPALSVDLFRSAAEVVVAVIQGSR